MLRAVRSKFSGTAFFQRRHVTPISRFWWCVRGKQIRWLPVSKFSHRTPFSAVGWLLDTFEFLFWCFINSTFTNIIQLCCEWNLVLLISEWLKVQFCFIMSHLESVYFRLKQFCNNNNNKSTALVSIFHRDGEMIFILFPNFVLYVFFGLF